MRTAFVWVFALLLGAAVPAILFALAGGGVWLIQPAFLITLCHAVVLGLPGAMLYRRFGTTRARWAMLGGFAIGAVPAAIFLGRTVTTAPELAQLIGGFGCLGASGAFTAWAVFRLTGTLKTA